MTKDQISGTLKLFMIIGLGALIITFQNCSPAHNEGDGSPSIAQDQDVGLRATAAKEILRQHCASCHGPGSEVETPIGDILNVDDLVAKELMVLGKPQESQVYLDMVDGVMPPEGDLLSYSELQAVAAWISDLGESNPNPTGGAEPEPEPGGGPGEMVTYTQIRTTIIVPRCLGCHSGAAPNGGGVNLETYVNVTNYVQPGAPNTSLLYGVVSSDRMPVNGPLSTPEKTMIFNWISQGANNN